jgi:hypothetical protein
MVGADTPEAEFPMPPQIGVTTPLQIRVSVLDAHIFR